MTLCARLLAVLLAVLAPHAFALESVPASPPLSAHPPPVGASAIARPVTRWPALWPLVRQHAVGPLTIDPQNGWITGHTKSGRDIVVSVPPAQTQAVIEALFWARAPWHFASDVGGLPPTSAGSWLNNTADVMGIAIGVIILIFLGWGWWRQRHASKDAARASGLPPVAIEESLPGDNATRFSDVAGCDQAKAEVREVVDFLRNPERFRRVGARMPTGILMAGPPGTGKTMLARAVAGEAGVPVLSLSGSAFTEMLVGVGAARVRALFDRAQEISPCVVFIDEIDAVAQRRSTSSFGGDREHGQTINEMLSRMDGFTARSGVVVMAATNRPDVLDPALLRPGRFDRTVTLGLPDRRGRLDILSVHARRHPVGVDVQWERVAAMTSGFSGADLANLINEAAIAAGRRKGGWLTPDDIEQARNRIIMGQPEGWRLDEDERRLTAYHEAGHALAACLLPGGDPVHAVTILPRARALGLTAFMPDRERHNLDAADVIREMVILMAGRAGERVGLGRATAGAGNDFERATRLARHYVGRWGLDETWGVAVTDAEATDAAWSESARARVDRRVRSLLRHTHATAMRLLTDHRPTLVTLADEIAREETVDGDRIRTLVHADQIATTSAAIAGPAPNTVTAAP